jgi:hypothetical protein
MKPIELISRVARFFLTQNTKTGKNIPNTKTGKNIPNTKTGKNIPNHHNITMNGHKIYQNYHNITKWS